MYYTSDWGRLPPAVIFTLCQCNCLWPLAQSSSTSPPLPSPSQQWHDQIINSNAQTQVQSTAIPLSSPLLEPLLTCSASLCVFLLNTSEYKSNHNRYDECRQTCPQDSPSMAEASAYSPRRLGNPSLETCTISGFPSTGCQESLRRHEWRVCRYFLVPTLRLWWNERSQHGSQARTA